MEGMISSGLGTVETKSCSCLPVGGLWELDTTVRLGMSLDWLNRAAKAGVV